MMTKSLLAVCLALAGTALQVDAAESPGSALVFPYVEYGSPARTIITVTNVNVSTRICDGSFREGDVIAHFLFFDDANCFVSDRSRQLTPGDTFSARIDEFIPIGATRGWVFVEALDPDSHLPIDFDYLIGSANLADRRTNLKWWYPAYGFKSLVQEGGSAFGSTSCGHARHSPASAEMADFDGIEYAPFPQTQFLDFFVGEGQPPELGQGSVVGSRLILMSTSPAETRVAIRLRNNNEVNANFLFRFECSLFASLSSLVGFARESSLRDSYDSRELGGLPTGWFSLEGDLPILGLYLQRVSRSDGTPIQSFGRPFQVTGVRLDAKIRR
jgi:hypothetical protein